jgi:hypothetical protein
MYLSQNLGKVCTALGAMTFLALSSALTASSLYTYMYSGPAFTIFDNNSAYLAPITNGNVDISLTLDDPILSNGVLTDYTSDIASFAVSDGHELLDSANATIDAYFGTTNGVITDWTITATAHDLGPNENYYQIDSETNTGMLNSGSGPFYSDIALNMDDSGNFSQGKATATGSNTSPFLSSTPEPSTEAMMFLGVFPFLIMVIVPKVRKRKEHLAVNYRQEK